MAGATRTLPRLPWRRRGALVGAFITLAVFTVNGGFDDAHAVQRAHEAHARTAIAVAGALHRAQATRADIIPAGRVPAEDAVTLQQVVGDLTRLRTEGLPEKAKGPSDDAMAALARITQLGAAGQNYITPPDFTSPFDALDAAASEWTGAQDAFVAADAADAAARMDGIRQHTVTLLLLLTLGLAVAWRFAGTRGAGALAPTQPAPPSEPAAAPVAPEVYRRLAASLEDRASAGTDHRTHLAAVVAGRPARQTPFHTHLAAIGLRPPAAPTEAAGYDARRALARTTHARDPAGDAHSDRVAALAARLAGELGWPEDRTARLHRAALLHDVGKVGVPDAVLHKAGRLTETERAVVETHAELGVRMVTPVLDEEQVAWVAQHHERLDGTGYPHGLRAADITQGARIIAVADAWDSMTGTRRAIPQHRALAVCAEVRGTQLCPDVVGALSRLAARGELSDVDPASGG
ncbi:MAG: HD domain-containing protein [Thermoleophilia bacterium]